MTVTQAGAIPSGEQIVLQPILYADLFDYPLTFAEIYNFLERDATPDQVSCWLSEAVQGGRLAHSDSLYHLPGRDNLVPLRRSRRQMAQNLWSQAERYSHWLAALPFVTMIAVTGSLAVNNPRTATDDIDLLIVTLPGRLWLCRAFIILLVRLARIRGVQLCPNFLITENALNFEQNLFVAREILQMKPLYGRRPYHLILDRNGWMRGYFPHNWPAPLAPDVDKLTFWQRAAKAGGQLLLAGFPGNWLEQRLRHYQIAKHTRQAARRNSIDTTIFTADICKGHYDGHGQRTLARYQQRLESIAGQNGAHTNGKQGGK
ncbi:MAG: hypothetical protein Kow0031_03980 [Anaerolineae bacterium]